MSSYKLPSKAISEKELLKLFFDLSFFLIPSSVIIKSNELKNIGGFQKSNYYPFVDIPTFFELSFKGAFIYSRNITCFYRKHKHSTWYRYAYKTQHMLRKEIHEYFKDSIRRKKIFFRGMDLQTILKNQKQYLGKKRSSHSKTIFIHDLIFSPQKKWYKPIVVVKQLLHVFISIKIFFYKIVRYIFI